MRLPRLVKKGFKCPKVFYFTEDNILTAKPDGRNTKAFRVYKKVRDNASPYSSARKVLNRWSTREFNRMKQHQITNN